MAKEETEKSKESSRERETEPAAASAGERFQKEVESTRQEQRDSANPASDIRKQSEDSKLNATSQPQDTASQHLPKMDLVDGANKDSSRGLKTDLPGSAKSGSETQTRGDSGGYSVEKFDAEGNRREVRNTDKDGKPVFEGKFDSSGKLEEGKYYQNGKLSETQTRGDSGGYSVEKFDAEGNRREVRNTDKDGKPVFEGKFDSSGKLEEGKYYQNGKLSETQTRGDSGGYSVEKFDAEGNRREVRNTDKDGKPVFGGKFDSSGKLEEGKYYQNGKLSETHTRNESGGYSIEQANKPESRNLNEQQVKDAHVRKGEGPYQVASRLLGDEASQKEKVALALAFKGQYDKETAHKDPEMRHLKTDRSMLNESNYKEVMERIGNDSLRESINTKLSQTNKHPGQEQIGSREPKTEPKADHHKAEPQREGTGKIDRSRFDQELKDPKVMAAFAGRMHSEVGSQGKAAQLAFAEEVMNRATSRGQSLMQALSGRYYPTSTPGRSDNPSYVETINKAWKEGTDTTHGATGNASGKVGFGRGGFQTVKIGGEKFGMEANDVAAGWLQKYQKLKA